MKKDTSRKRKFFSFCFAIVIVALCFLQWRINDSLREDASGTSAGRAGNSEELVSLFVDEIYADRLSKQTIQISWPDSLDAEVEQYIVKKRQITNSNEAETWCIVDTVSSDHQIDGNLWKATDKLADATIHQYEYTVEVQARDPSKYESQEGERVLASNLLVCIDPGHYKGVNQLENGYVEGDVTLQLALMLRDDLKRKYGINSCLTRETSSITLNGYTDEALDSAHLELRGLYAGEMGSDIFLSLHTNANETNANGFETCSQPIAINKPILIVNTATCAAQTAIKVANAIGTSLSAVNYEMGLSTVMEFRTVAFGQVDQWTDSYNDSLDMPGTVFCKFMDDGRDYYGVLRGAACAGVPGIIIEHGMHTVPEVRIASTGGDLIERWAAADAYGVAQGFGFTAQGE